MTGNLSDVGGGNALAQPEGSSRYAASGLTGPWQNYSQGHAFKKCSCGAIMGPSQTGKCELCERLSHSQSVGRPPYDNPQEAGDKAGKDNQVID